MKVKITGAQLFDFWYANKIREEFEVEDSDKFWYKVVGAPKYINKEDCSVVLTNDVEQQKPNKQHPLLRQFKALETHEGLITKGKIYKESKPYLGNQGCINIVSDDGCHVTLYEERFEEVLSCEIVEKPPLGLRPEFIVLEHRQKEIQEAVMRYLEVGKEIPKEWTAEYYRNSSRLLEKL